MSSRIKITKVPKTCSSCFVAHCRLAKNIFMSTRKHLRLGNNWRWIERHIQREGDLTALPKSNLFAWRERLAGTFELRRMMIRVRHHHMSVWLANCGRGRACLMAPVTKLRCCKSELTVASPLCASNGSRRFTEPLSRLRRVIYLIVYVLPVQLEWHRTVITVVSWRKKAARRPSSTSLASLNCSFKLMWSKRIARKSFCGV